MPDESKEEDYLDERKGQCCWNTEQLQSAVLVLTGIELVAGMGLCFRFVTKTLLATWGYFNYLRSVKDLLVSHPIARKQAGGAQGVGEDTGSSCPQVKSEVSMTINLGRHSHAVPNMHKHAQLPTQIKTEEN